MLFPFAVVPGPFDDLLGIFLFGSVVGVDGHVVDRRGEVLTPGDPGSWSFALAVPVSLALSGS